MFFANHKKGKYVKAKDKTAAKKQKAAIISYYEKQRKDAKISIKNKNDK